VSPKSGNPTIHKPRKIGDMRGQGLNTHRFMLTSSSQEDYCPAVARIQIAKAVLDQDGHSRQ
jgi:hypothetical protein